MNTQRVLVFPGGTEIGLEINQALRACKEISLLSAGMEGADHAPYVFDRHFILPHVSDEAWLDKLNGLIKQENITHIFPAHDDVSLVLARNQRLIQASILCSPVETCEVLRSKRRTYELLKEVIPTPKVFDVIDDVSAFPVFCKPDRGQGAQGARRIENSKELDCLSELWDDLVVAEYLPGNEFTVDCFSDREKGLLFHGGRLRERIRNGIAVATRPVIDEVFAFFALRISERFKFHGAWFFQLKADRFGTLKLLEASPRIAGSMAMYRALGVNFPLLTVMESLRMPISIMPNSIDIKLNRALANRFEANIEYDTVYIDFDDTIVVHDRLNTLAVRLLFQWVQSGKRIVLLTRHKGDLYKTLNRFRLSQMFDEVHIINDGVSKSEYIDGTKRSVFIDDSFRERSEVANRHRIPTFDTSMIEALVDDRA